MALYALDEAAEFLQHALAHATTDVGRAAVHDDLARAAEHSGQRALRKTRFDAVLPDLVGEAG
jgi:hypothetical protein